MTPPIDCITLLGNKSGDRSGLNFDRLDNSEKNPDQIPDCSQDFESSESDSSSDSDSFNHTTINIKPPRNPLSAGDIHNKMIDDDKYSTKADILFEVFLINGKFKRCEEYDKIPEWFANDVMPFAKKKLEYSGFANPVSHRFIPHHFEIRPLLEETQENEKYRYKGYGIELPKEFPYFGYMESIFKYTECKKLPYDERKNFLKNTDMFPEIKENQKVWFRIWYNQIWEGLVQKKTYTSFITDPCLIWTAYELNLLRRDEIPTQTRSQLWNDCRRTILNLHYPLDSWREYAWPIVLGHFLCPGCPFYKEKFDTNAFLVTFKFMIGERRFKEAYKLKGEKRRKCELSK